MTPSAVLFDIDGTLVDSNYQHIRAWVGAFCEIGRPVPAWRVHRCIGMDSAKLLGELLGPDADRLGDRAKKAHDERYLAESGSLVVLPGARELIAAVAARGSQVVLATSAPPKELEVLRSVLQIEDAIAVVTSADDVDQAKPAPDLVTVAITRAGVDAERAIMVGDTVWDVRAAADAGVRCLGVRSGGLASADLWAVGALEVYDDAAQLLAELDASPLAELWK
jgi:HAD superfamily hydrolase (TIGR01509 family)